MQNSELTANLEAKFGATSRIDKDDLKEWIIREHIHPTEIDTLYQVIVEGYGSGYEHNKFPPLTRIIELWEKYRREYPIRKFHTSDTYLEAIAKLKIEWQRWTDKKIEAICNSIQEKIINGKYINNEDKEFWYLYSELWAQSCKMKDAKWNPEIITARSRQIRECIEAGRSYRSVFEEIDIPSSRKINDAAKSVIKIMPKEVDKY